MNTRYMTILCRDRPCKSHREVLLLLFLILLLRKCSSHRVSLESDVSYRQAFMDSSAKDGPSPEPSHPRHATLHSEPSARYTILITLTIVLLLACALVMHFMIKCALTCSVRQRNDEESMASTDAPKQADESKIELGLLPVAVYCKLPWRPASITPPAPSPAAVSLHPSADAASFPPSPAAVSLPPSPSAASLPPSPAAAPLPPSLRDSQCAICLNEFCHGEKMRVLPHCGHGFHVSCIDVWLAAQSSCPTCRFDLNTLIGLRSKKIMKPQIPSIHAVNPLFQW